MMSVVDEKASRRPLEGPDPLSSATAGACAGLGGAIVAHILTVSLSRLIINFSPQGTLPFSFYSTLTALHTAIFYGAIAWAAGGRLSVAAVGFAIPFLLILIPMFILSRAFQGASSVVEIGRAHV